MLYRRREIWLLLALAVSLGVGLAVGQLRNAFPDLADRLEKLDTGRAPDSARSPRPAKISEAHVRREGPLDLNRATAQELRRLPGIGPTLAARILRTRERRGRFEAADDLLVVPGVGPKKLERIKTLVTARE